MSVDDGLVILRCLFSKPTINSHFQLMCGRLALTDVASIWSWTPVNLLKVTISRWIFFCQFKKSQFQDECFRQFKKSQFQDESFCQFKKSQFQDELGTISFASLRHLQLSRFTWVLVSFDLHWLLSLWNQNVKRQECCCYAKLRKGNIRDVDKYGLLRRRNMKQKQCDGIGFEVSWVDIFLVVLHFFCLLDQVCFFTIG